MDYLSTQLEQRLGLDSESARDLARYPSQNSRQETADFFYGLLGDASGQVLQEYYDLTSTPPASSGTSTPTATASGTNTPNMQNEINISTGVPQFRGVWGETQRREKSPQLKKSPASSSKASTPSKVKVDSLADIDAAISQLEVSNADQKSRTRCDCMAMRHGLFDMAPNCLHCGKIICKKEGLGPCTSCGKPLIEASQLAEITHILHAEREMIASSMGKKARQKAGLESSNQDRSTNLAKANAQLEKLLEFQESSAQRTKIIDQVSDFDMSTSASKWASPAEQAEQLKRQQRQLRKTQLENEARTGRGKRNVVLSLRGGKVYMEERAVSVESQLQEEEKENPGVEEPSKPSTTVKPNVSSYWNPKKDRAKDDDSIDSKQVHFTKHKSEFRGATSEGPDRVKFDSADLETLLTLA